VRFAPVLALEIAVQSVALSKRVVLGGTQAITARVEVFNLLNRGQLHIPNFFASPRGRQPRRVVVHHVEGCSFPNWIGTRQERHFHFDGPNPLALETQTSSGRAAVIWERVPHFSHNSAMIGA
jgi:hypothetical protein